jgi:hypothetical protein
MAALQLILENDERNVLSLSPNQLKIYSETYRCKFENPPGLFELEYERVHDCLISFAKLEQDAEEEKVQHEEEEKIELVDKIVLQGSNYDTTKKSSKFEHVAISPRGQSSRSMFNIEQSNDLIPN